VLGSFHSLAPVAKPTKLATLLGDLFGKSVQVMRPAVVSMTAVGLVAAGIGEADSLPAGFCVDFFSAGVVWAAAAIDKNAATTMAKVLFIATPDKKTKHKGHKGKRRSSLQANRLHSFWRRR